MLKWENLISNQRDFFFFHIIFLPHGKMSREGSWDQPCYNRGVLSCDIIHHIAGASYDDMQQPLGGWEYITLTSFCFALESVESNHGFLTMTTNMMGNIDMRGCALDPNKYYQKITYWPQKENLSNIIEE